MSYSHASDRGNQTHGITWYDVWLRGEEGFRQLTGDHLSAIVCARQFLDVVPAAAWRALHSAAGPAGEEGVRFRGRTEL